MVNDRDFPARAFVPQRRADHRVKAKGIRVKRILLPLPLINGNRGETRKFRRIESVVKRVLFSLPREWKEYEWYDDVTLCVRKGMGKIEIFKDNISGNAIYFHHLFSDDLIFRVYVNWGWGCYYLGNYCSIVSWSNQLHLLLHLRICLLYFYNHFLYKTKELLLRKGLRKMLQFFFIYI